MRLRQLLMKVRRRVPETRQYGPMDCAAACLSATLAYFGKLVTERQCARMMDAGRSGVTAATILRVAQRFGVEGKGYSVKSLSDLARMPTPCILHWEFRHFVVLVRCDQHSAKIMDPALGMRRVSAAELSRSFTGIVLTFKAGVSTHAGGTEPVGEPGRGWIPYLTARLAAPGLMRHVAHILAASFVVQAVGLLMPLATKFVVDLVLPTRDVALLVLFGAAFVAAIVASACTNYVRESALIRLRAILDLDLAFDLFGHLLRLPYRFFLLRPSGDLVSRLGSLASIREALTNQGILILFDGAFALTYMVALTLLAWPLAVATILFGAAEATLLLTTGRRTEQLLREELNRSGREQALTVEVLRGIATVKANNAERNAFERWRAVYLDYLAASLLRLGHVARVDTVVTLLRRLAPFALLCTAAAVYLQGELSIGDLFALTAIASAVLGPLSGFVASAHQFQLVKAHLYRVSEILEEHVEAATDGQLADPAGEEVGQSSRLRGAIELDGVSFRYHAGDRDVLRDVSLSIGPGEKVGIVGATGSGKSTLVGGLAGLFVPQAGRVLYDGMDVKQVGWQPIRSQVGTVLQDATVFTGTIRDNVDLLRPDASIEEVRAAMSAAQMDQAVEAMPMGLETIVAEGGQAMSGGERQRIALARGTSEAPIGSDSGRSD